MLPGSLIGVFFVVCLVPGWTYYRATRAHRPPVQQSSLAESFELIATGIATTGAATFFAALTVPEHVLALGRIKAATDLRDAAILGACLIGAATGLALLASAVYARSRPASYGRPVWAQVLSERELDPSLVHFLRVQLTDGRRFEGLQRSFTFSAEAANRDIALRKPIYEGKGTRRTLTGFDSVLVPAAQIAWIAVADLPADGSARAQEHHPPRTDEENESAAGEAADQG